jgi:hypothetical protein
MAIVLRMDTIISNAAVACDIPDDIDRDALSILREAAFAWDADLLAFRRGRATIEYAFLRGQKLVVVNAMTAQERIGQLQRLRILLQSID